MAGRDELGVVRLHDAVGLDIGRAGNEAVGTGQVGLLAAGRVGPDDGGGFRDLVRGHGGRGGIIRLVLGHGQRESEFGPALRQRRAVRSGAQRHGNETDPHLERIARHYGPYDECQGAIAQKTTG